MAGWIIRVTNEEINGVCSECGYVHDRTMVEEMDGEYHFTRFCPWCGAELKNWYEARAVADTMLDEDDNKNVPDDCIKDVIITVEEKMKAKQAIADENADAAKKIK